MIPSVMMDFGELIVRNGVTVVAELVTRCLVNVSVLLVKQEASVKKIVLTAFSE